MSCINRRKKKKPPLTHLRTQCIKQEQKETYQTNFAIRLPMQRIRPYEGDSPCQFGLPVSRRTDPRKDLTKEEIRYNILAAFLS